MPFPTSCASLIFKRRHVYFRVLLMNSCLALALVVLFTAPRALHGQTNVTTAEEIGSLRNARVAVPLTDKKTELTYFTGSMSSSELEELRKIAPNLRIVTGLSAAQALARAEEAHGVE